MKKIFENKQFALELTGHKYDFVAIMETKTGRPLTFFFSEELAPTDEEDEDCEWVVNEDETELKAVFKHMTDDADEVQETAFRLSATSWLRTRDDRSTGFLADCKDRGQLLAIVKQYCPEKLEEVKTAIY